MSVEFIKQLHQASLEKAWNARPAKAPKDPMLKRRQNVMSRIDAALAQLQSGEINPPRGSYQTRDNFNGVRVQLKCGQRALTVEGRDHWFVEDAATFFSLAREAVASGELDRAIIDALEGKGKDKSTDKDTRPAPRIKAPELRIVSDLEAAPDGKAGGGDLPAAKPLEPAKVRTLDVAPVGKASADELPMARPFAPEGVPTLDGAPVAEASADEPRAAKPGKFAQKYEKLLAAGIISEPALGN